MRVAWFSPLPPHRSGIAAYSADVLPKLAVNHSIDVYVDDAAGAETVRRTVPVPGVEVRGAHDFLWRHPQQPYECVVYQLGNDSCHDYEWPYLLQYPGLVVMHDAQLHQARARALLRRGLEEEYVQEFLYSHPCAPEAVARTVAAGLGGGLYYLWPMVRVPLEAARLVAVHNRWLAAHLSELYPDSPVTTIRMGVPDPLPLASKPPAEIRRRHRIPEDALLCVAVGQVTAEKGLTRVLMALSTMERSVAPVHLLCVGASGSDFDLLARARDVGAGDRVHLTGYVPDDALPSYLAAADLCLCLRWPTSRETSASWLRCVAAGRPTVITNLLHTIDLPTIDLRTMTVFPDPAADPIAIGVDLVDDLDMLRVTFRRIGADTALRRRIGEAARRYWESNASLEVMVADYADALERARSLQPRDPGVGRPAHLSANGTEKARRLVEAAGLADAARSRLDEVFDRAPRHEATADGERP